jgi:hypothetical protein
VRDGQETENEKISQIENNSSSNHTCERKRQSISPSEISLEMLVGRSDPVGAVIIVVRAFSLNNLLRKRTNREKKLAGWFR